MKLDLQGSAFCPERERTACRGDGLPASGATETHCELAYRTGGRPAIDVRVWHRVGSPATHCLCRLSGEDRKHLLVTKASSISLWAGRRDAQKLLQSADSALRRRCATLSHSTATEFLRK